MHPRPWPVPLWVLLVSLLAAAQARATGREVRQGTVLVAEPPGGAPPVLYVAARFSTLVDFEELLEPRALLTPELLERLGVVPVGPRSLALLPLRDLAEGERLLVRVTGRTGAGESRTLTLALVTRRDEVDQQARVYFAPREPPRRDTEGEVAAVARMLLASHEPGARPRVALVTPEEPLSFEYSDDIRAHVDSILRLDRRFFVSVSVGPMLFTARPWRLARVRMEPGCEPSRANAGPPLPVLVTMAASGKSLHLYTFSALIPEGTGCVTLTLEEDGPRVIRFERVRLPP
ncbi:DUF2381 family protein [Archangium violaceum]|uniref:DUF2381 family protein n=1 Tax=Archangium violaceum TaxID=83451 RepID=UPI00193C3055|nr:DUF2381 family protein [Archangium violaceum]QRK10994.1 DUF2381 family protein [Archangium violaceum]